MNKETVIENICGVGILPVIRTRTGDEAVEVCRALVAGGINALEITLTVPDAASVIGNLRKEFDENVIIGAGSILTAENARQCIDAGARFVVSPTFNREVVAVCQSHHIAVMPGALTPTEIVAAWAAGADVVKVFPADAMGGANYLRAVKAPLPQIKLMPTGGVTLETAADYISAGAVAVGAGSDLVDTKLLRAGKTEEITLRAKLYVAAVRAARATLVLLFMICVCLSATNAGLRTRNVENNADEFDRLRGRWAQMLTGGANLDLKDADISRRIEMINGDAEKAVASLNKSNPREFLWSDAAGTTDSADITKNYERLEAMTLAVATRGTKLYQNTDLKREIVGALEWLDANRYNAKTAYYSNWWHLEIGAPLRVNNIVVLLYEDLTPELRARLMAAVKRFNPDFNRYADNKDTATGANRVWKATTQILRGMILEDAAEVIAGRDNLSDAGGNGASSVFKEVTSGDGFYADGSFIQHVKHPYTGGYGKSFLGNVADLVYLLDGSRFRVTDPQHRNLYRWIENAYVPLMYKGAIMDMVRGREISRASSQDHVAGHAVIRGILRVAQFAPAAQAEQFEATAKAMIAADAFRRFYDYAALETIANAKKLMADKSVRARSETARHKQFPLMDRVVHHRPGFAFGVAMSSRRTFKYESINNENLRGWFTSDGATYLYNDDLAQFSEDFWATVDARRLPGTTVDASHRQSVSILYQKEFLPMNVFAGGANLGEYAVAGMELSAEHSTLTARKSWFMFDDEIVCLGAGITNSDNREIETVVENRRLSDVGMEVLTVSNAAQKNTASAASSFGQQQTIKDLAWAHLAGVRGAGGIGYYFPQPAELNVLRDRRTDSWTSINTGTLNNTKHTRNYLTAWFAHGKNPEAATYAYVLLPNRTAAETSEYAGGKSVRIIENSAEAQAVENASLQILAINFWTNAVKTVGGISCDKPAAVVVREGNGKLEIAVSDSTQTNRGAINVTLDRSAAKNLRLLAADKNITFTQSNAKIRLSVNARDAAGKTFVARFVNQ